MIARARTAQSTQKVNYMLSTISGKTSIAAFTRMEDKVEQLEVTVEGRSELGNMLLGSSDASVGKQFQLLEARLPVDDELAKLKQNLLTGGAAPKRL